MNTIYTNFLKAYLQQKVILAGEGADEFKIALFTDGYTPDNDDKKYADLVKAGYEVQGLGYRSGGKAITFKEPVENEERLDFLGSNVIWNNATFVARYGVIYRVSDGMLISCYDFGMNQSVEAGKFNLSWKGTSTISISLASLTEQAKTLDVDSVLSLSSKNPVENKVLTDIFRALGVKIGGESVPESAECIDEDIDTINSVSHRDIDSLFNIYHKVTVHFDTQAHGPNPQDITAEVGTKIVLPKVEYEGCTFLAWYSDPACDESHYVGKAFDAVAFKAEGEVTLYAKWNVINYTVSFNVNGHGITPDVKIGVYGDTFELPQVECETHTLVQWYSDVLYTNPVGAPGDIYTITGPAILYAKWEINVYTVTFHTDGGSTIESQRVEAGSRATQPADPTKQGYVFVAWYSDVELTHPYSFTTEVYADTNLYARWGSQLYTITWEPENAAPSFTTTQYYLTNVVLPNVPEFRGYTFLGWFTEREGGVQVTSATRVMGDATYYAQWKSNWYTIDFSNNGIGADIPSITAELGSMFYLPGPLAEGYTFDGWYRDEECTVFVGNRGSEYIVRGKETLYAKWTAKTYKISWVYQNDNADSSWTTVTRNATHGSVVVLPADLESHVINYTNYYVEGWYTTKSGGIKVTPDTRVVADVTYYAHRLPQRYTVTFDNGGIGSECAPMTQDYNGYILLPNNYADGYHFDGWYLGTAHIGMGGDYYKVTGNITLYAKWTINVYTIVFDSNGGTVIDNQYVTYGEKVTKPTNPVKAEFLFDTWCIDPELTLPYDFDKAVGASMTLYAKWTALPYYTITYVNDPQHGPTPDPVTKALGSPVNLPTMLQTGWTLEGWYDENEVFIGRPGAGYVIERDIILTARWTRNTYTLVWNGQNGAENFLTYKKYEEYVTLPSELDPPYVPTYTGYTFNNWYTQPEGGDVVTDNIQVLGSMTFFAHWIPNEYTLTWVSNNTVHARTTQFFGTSIILPDDPEPPTSGDVFLGWYDSLGNRITPSTMVPAANTQYTAQWNRQYTITYVANGHGVAPDPVSQQDDVPVILANIEDEGYTLVGWYDNEECTGTMVGAPGEGYCPNVDVTLYAKWVVKSITITWDNWDDGENITTSTQDYGTPIVFPQTPEPPTTGDTFRGWYDKNGDVIPTELIVTANITCYGKWNRFYTITYFNNGYGGETPEPVTRPDNTPVILPSLTDPDRTFVGWYRDNIRDEEHYAGTGGDSFKDVNNVNLYAQWDTRYCTIFWNSTGGQAIESTSQRAEEFLVLPSPAPTREHYTFAGWWTEITGGEEVDETTLVPNQNYVEYFAHWDADMFEITWTSNGETYETTTQGWGTNLILPVDPTPAPSSGDTFIGWFTEEEGGTQVDSTVIITEDVEYFAHWNKMYTITYRSEYGGTPSPSTQPDGTVVNLPTAASMIAPGLDFDKWYETSTFEEGTDVPFQYSNTVNVTLYAHWTPKEPASVTYDYNGITGKGTESSSAYVGDTIYLKSPSLPLGYNFLGWYEEASAVTKAGDSGSPYMLTNAATTLYASYTYNPVTVDLDFIDIIAQRQEGYDGFYNIGYKSVPEAADMDFPVNVTILQEDTPHIHTEFGWTPDPIDDISALQNTLTRVEYRIDTTEIPTEAFKNYIALEEVVIPPGIETIGADAFRGVTTLKNVYIGEDVNNIAGGAFAACPNIERYEVKATTPPDMRSSSLSVNENTKIFVPSDAFANYIGSDIWSAHADNIYTRIKVDFSDMRSGSDTHFCIGYKDEGGNEITFPVTKEVNSLKNTYEPEDFGWTPILKPSIQEYKDTLKYCEIPSSITSLPDASFDGYDKLEAVIIPNSVTGVGTGVFGNCRKLRSVVISNTLGSLDDNMFRNCRNLKEILVPANINALGRYAFEGCGLLATCRFKATTPPTIYDTSLPNNSGIRIYVPAGTRNAYITANIWNRYSSVIVEETN